MTQSDWEEMVEQLRLQSEIVESWEPDQPNLTAERCHESRHRTLGHLRACQEQWLIALEAFLESDNPSLTFLHPWRHFESKNYSSVPWEEHMDAYRRDRSRWRELVLGADRTRGGKWNRKPDTVEGLTKRLAMHEAHHISDLASHQKRRGN